VDLLAGDDRLVAVPSPPVPAYHRRMLELRATPPVPLEVGRGVRERRNKGKT